MFFGGGCNNNSDSWIWIVVIVHLLYFAVTVMFSAEAITTAVAVVIHAATLAVTITKTIAAKIYCT